MRTFLTSLFLFIIGACAEAQYVYSPCMPTNTQAQWMGNAGVPGGVKPIAGQNLYATNWGFVGDGVTDNYPMWTNVSYSLRNSNYAEVVVNLPPGNFYSSQGFQFPYANGVPVQSPVILRGAGPRITTLLGPRTGPIVSFRGATCGGCGVYPITGTCHQGDFSVTVASGAASTMIGKVMSISQANDPAFVTTTDYDGPPGCTYCGSNGTNCAQQFVVVTNVVGTTVIQFAQALLYAYNQSPIIQLNEIMQTNSGVENMTITRRYPLGSGGGVNIDFEDCWGCWVTNVENSWCCEAGIKLGGCFECTIANNYTHDARSTQTSQAYGIWLLNYNSCNLIENNAFNNLQFAVATEAGSSQNVIDYNFATNMVVGGASMLGNLTVAFPTHGAHAWFNLYDGNNCTAFRGDWAHGSASFNTYFRNYCQMASYVAAQVYGNVNTDVLNYIGLPSWPGGFVTNQGGFIAFAFDTFTYSNNVVGNVISTNLQTAATQAGVSMLFSNGPLTSILEAQAMVLRFGATTPGFSGVQTDPIPGLSTFVHANWDPVNNGVVYSGTYPTNLPNSLYYASKPTWWDADLPWPPITATNNTVTRLPAQRLYDRFVNSTIQVNW